MGEHTEVLKRSITDAAQAVEFPTPLKRTSFLSHRHVVGKCSYMNKNLDDLSKSGEGIYDPLAQGVSKISS